ncbi:MAG: glycosyltransferase family 4 protein [bacterium]
MKIFLIRSSLIHGGAERVITELANEFAKNKHEVHMVILAVSEDFYSLHPEIKIHRLGFLNKGALKKQFAELKTFFKLRELLKTERPDASLSFGPKYNILTILASSFLGLKIFVSDRSNPRKKIDWHIDLVRRLTYRFANGVIAQTSLAKKLQERTTGNKNIKVIPNPVKEVKLYPEIKCEKIILNVGRLVPEKGQKFLLEAFKNLNVSDWKLVILGDGPLRGDLENQAKKLQIENKVIMPGAVNNVDEWLAKASIFAFPSVSEGFPNALLEAMAAELPCVSFDCDAGPRDIITDGENGFLVELYDVEAFSNKLEQLTNSIVHRQKIGYSAKQYAKRFNIRDISEAFLGFITKNN